jgi:hypothetical protein
MIGLVFEFELYPLTIDPLADAIDVILMGENGIAQFSIFPKFKLSQASKILVLLVHTTHTYRFAKKCFACFYHSFLIGR